jgi:hypothetical protein
LDGNLFLYKNKLYKNKIIKKQIKQMDDFHRISKLKLLLLKSSIVHDEIQDIKKPTDNDDNDDSLLWPILGTISSIGLTTLASIGTIRLLKKINPELHLKLKEWLFEEQRIIEEVKAPDVISQPMRADEIPEQKLNKTIYVTDVNRTNIPKTNINSTLREVVRKNIEDSTGFQNYRKNLLKRYRTLEARFNEEKRKIEKEIKRIKGESSSEKQEGEVQKSLELSKTNLEGTIISINEQRQYLESQEKNFKNRIFHFLDENEERYTTNRDAWIPVIDMVEIVSYDSDVLLKSLKSNWILMGPAGSGKTTTAELCGMFLYYMGIYVEEPITVQKMDFSSTYGGGATLTKTNTTLLKSLGRLMVIDEAYNIFVGGDGRPHQYSNDIADVMLTFMTKNQGTCSLVAVGYEKSIQKYFLDINSGFNSRFPFQETIKPIDLDDLKKIFLKEVKTALSESVSYTQKAKNFIDFIIVKGFFTSFVRDMQSFISGLVSYVASLPDKNAPKCLGILFMFNVMRKYCSQPLCRESFKNILPPLPERIELDYLMKKDENVKEDKKNNIQKKLESGYKIKDVYKDDKTNKYAYTIKNNKTEEIGMILPWELTIYANDESKKENQYIIVGQKIDVFNSEKK